MTPAVPWERIETVAKRWDAEKYIPGAQARIAEEYGVSARTIQRWLQTYRAKTEADPATRNAMDAIGAEYEPSAFWAKQQKDGTVLHSVLMSKRKDEQTVAEAVREALTGLEAVEPIPAPQNLLTALLSAYILTDVHWGMMAWGKETDGPDYNIKLAEKDMDLAFANVMALIPDSERALLIVNGDFFHSNDQSNLTPASKHTLDMDTRYAKVIRSGVAVVAKAIDRLLQKHANVEVWCLKGNHDEDSIVALLVGLMERYRNEPRVSVRDTARGYEAMQFGQNVIAATHGHEFKKPEDFALILADRLPYWSLAKHRRIYTGHVHRLQVRTLPGAIWESLPAFCPSDAYGARFGGRRSFRVDVFHEDKGLIQQAHDPIEREDG